MTVTSCAQLVFVSLVRRTPNHPHKQIHPHYAQGDFIVSLYISPTPNPTHFSLFATQQNSSLLIKETRQISSIIFRRDLKVLIRRKILLRSAFARSSQLFV